MKLAIAHSRVGRTALTLGATIALVIGFSGSAHAGDTEVTLTEGGHRLGYIRHLDPDPDRFVVCDTHANGHGVTGSLYTWLIYPVNKWHKLDEVSDGGDATCDSFEEDLVGGHRYQMRIEDNGGRGIELKNFEE